MEKSMISFLVKAGSAAVLLSIAAFSLLGKYTQTFMASRFHLFNLFVFLVTAFVHYRLMKAGERRVQKFINSFMLSMLAKLMIFFIVIVAYSLTHKEEAIPFIVSFFIMYVVYTALEVIEILNFLSASNVKNNEENKLD